MVHNMVPLLFRNPHLVSWACGDGGGYGDGSRKISALPTADPSSHTDGSHEPGTGYDDCDENNEDDVI